MAGMEIMLKAMGIDPVQIKEAGESFGRVAAEIIASQKRCEEKMDRILSLLETKENENGK